MSGPSSGRVVLAHLPHPDREGDTLCGRPASRVEPCRDCVSRRDALLLVHVQSIRDVRLALCGMPLVRGGRGPAPAYLSSSVRRGAGRALLDLHGVPVCPWCQANLRRLEDAADRRSSAGSAMVAQETGSGVEVDP